MVILVGGWATASAGGPAAPTAWVRLFSASRPAEGDVEAVLAACGSDVASVRKLIASDVAYGQRPAGWQRHALKVTGRQKVRDVSFHVRTPRGYDPSRKSYPLLLAAHGQYSTGLKVGRMMEWLLRGEVETYVVLAPTMPGPPVFTGEPYQEQAYLAALAWVRRHMNVDDDRVHVSGYSLGGHTTWHLATMFPRHFASALPMAGVPRFEGAPHTSFCYMANLGNLPVWAIWGERDRRDPKLKGNVDDSRAAAQRLARLRNPHFKGTELPGVGHKGCFPPQGGMARYFAVHRRRAVPEAFTHRFHLRNHARGYYLRALSLAGKPLDLGQPLRVPLPAGSGGTQAEARRAVEKFIDDNVYEMRATLAPRSNALTVRAKRIRRVRILVLDGMFDLDKPVSLRFGGSGWTGRIKPSARCMLTHYAAQRDATGLVLNEVDIDEGGKVTVRY